jgi:glycopeptide antibiotics resistance protein
VATIVLLAAVQRRRRAKSYLGIPMLLVAGPYAASVLCEALAPLFHSAPLPFLQGGPLSRLRLALDAALPLAATEIPIIDVALFGAAGFLLVALRRESRGTTRAEWLFVGVPAAVVVIGAHVIHGAFGLAVRWEALVTDAVALAFGAWVASRWLASITRNYRGAARARLCMLAYTVLLVLWGWRPLVPKTQLAAIAAQINVASLTPLQSLAERVDVFSALHVAQQFLLYVPLGALLAVWPLRRSGRLAGIRPAVWLAAVIELGHIVVAGRTFDVTNFLLALAGLGIGWIAVRRCGYEPHGTVASVGFRADSVRRDPQARTE